jgi:hypothetical protein
MRQTVRGFFGILTVIALVALAGGYVQAQPLPLVANNPAITVTADAYATMAMKINQQCTDQESTSATAFVTKKTTVNEKTIIGYLDSVAISCTATPGAFPADLNKAKLQYQFDGTDFIVKVVDNTGAGVDISTSCMALEAIKPAVWSGTQDLTTTVNSIKAQGLYDMNIVINIPTKLAVTLAGIAKENLNLPKLPKGKTKQTLSDNWTFSGGGAGTIGTKDVVCTGTAGANGTLKRP